jgi:hypothetical protein
MQVYRIFNKKNGKSYIGITKWTFNERYPQSKWWKWTHSNHLKKAVKKYGIEEFAYEILNNSCKNDSELVEMEKLYIKQYNSFIPNGYNLTLGGSNQKKATLEKEYELIDANGTLYKIKNMSDFCRKNGFNYGSMLNMVSGINKSSHGFALSTTDKDDIINPNQEWELEEIKTGKIFKIKRKNINDFCKQIGVRNDYIYMLVNKKVYVSHGFKLKETILDGVKIKEDRLKYKNIKFINPKGEEVIIENLYRFCQKNPNLERGGFYDLINNKSLEYHGWRLPYQEKEFKELKQKRYGRFLKLKNIITGEIFEIKNVSKFCRDNNIDINIFNTMINGNIKQYMNYAIPETDLTNYKYPKKVIFISIINKNGSVLDGRNAKDIEKRFGIMTSQSIQDMINKKYASIKGWRILKVKYKNNYYPEIDNS